MITAKPLTCLEDFENLKKGDVVACEFKINIHDMPREPYRFRVFEVAENKARTKEIILQIKNNIYFNYEMYLNEESILKNISLISID